MDQDEPHQFLSSLLNQNLRVHTTDGRLFWGSFKCTDPESNIVLAQTYEYRKPSKPEDGRTQSMDERTTTQNDDDGEEMVPRYLGLVVVPGHHIVKMEVDRFASQMRGGVI